jgi:hypothetical protein
LIDPRESSSQQNMYESVVESIVVDDNLSVKESIKDRFDKCMTSDQYKSLWRSLVNEYHPDKGGSNDMAQYIVALKNQYASKFN